MKTSAVLKPWLRSVETIRIDPKAAPTHSSANTSRSLGSTSGSCDSAGAEAATAAAAIRATYAWAAPGSERTPGFAGAASGLLVSIRLFIGSPE